MRGIFAIKCLIQFYIKLTQGIHLSMKNNFLKYCFKESETLDHFKKEI